MILVDGVRATDVYYIWSARYDLAGETKEVIFPEGQRAAEDSLAYAPGTLWKRKAYATEGNPVAHVEEAEEVSRVGQLN
jgi:hypothetical protein